MAVSKQKILIVEDDLDIAEMVNVYFHNQGYEVFTVNWGEDGVRACQTNHPDLVILDIRLPDIDGYEVAHRLRSDRRTSNVPIIFLTEKRELSDKLQGLALGADDYITKPFDIQELRLRVRNSLARMNQGSLNNPVSGLPEGQLVEERFAEAVAKGGASLLVISLDNIDTFRETYGFVASDDVLRAFSLMIYKAMQELGAGDDFLGHVGTAEFLLILQTENLPRVQERLRTRLIQSLDYFYPIKDREHASQQSGRLSVGMGEIQNIKGRFNSMDQLKAEILRIKR